MGKHANGSARAAKRAATALGSTHYVKRLGGFGERLLACGAGDAADATCVPRFVTCKRCLRLVADSHQNPKAE